MEANPVASQHHLWARTHWPDMPDTERQEHAERALRELLDDQLIFFFRAPRADEMHDLYALGVDPARVLKALLVR